MIRKANELESQKKESLRGGAGSAMLKFYIGADDKAEHCSMAAQITLNPKSGIGEHDHVEDAELYVILSGKAMASDNGEQVELGAGDAMWTSNGERHSLYNHTDEPTVLLAVVVK